GHPGGRRGGQHGEQRHLRAVDAQAPSVVNGAAVGGGAGADLVALGEHDGVGRAVHEGARGAARVALEHQPVARVAGGGEAAGPVGRERRRRGRGDGHGQVRGGAVGGGAVGGAEEDLDDVGGGPRRGAGGAVVGGRGGPLEELVDVVLLDVGQDVEEQALQPGPGGGVGAGVHHGRQLALVGVVVVVHRQGHLAQVVGAGGAGGGRAHLLHSGQEQADEHGDDGDDHQQLNQREGGPQRPDAGADHEMHLAGTGTKGTSPGKNDSTRITSVG